MPYRYENVAQYLEDTDNAFDFLRVASIGGKLYSSFDLDAIENLTDTNLPESLGTLDDAIAIDPLWFHKSLNQYIDRRLDHIADGIKQVVIGGKVYRVADLEAVLEDDEELTLDNLPDPVKGAKGAMALGTGAQAPGEKSVALGWGSLAYGQNAIAIGSRVKAAANQVVIGTSDHSYRLPGLGASQTAKTEIITVDGDGDLSADGGALYTRVESLEGRVTTLEAEESTTSGEFDSGSIGSSTSAVVAHVTSTVDGGQSDEGSLSGSALARTVASVEPVPPVDGLDSEVDGSELHVASEELETRVSALEARTVVIGTDLGAVGDPADPVGSAHARVSHIQELIDTAGTSDAAVLHVVDGTRELTVEEIGEVYSSVQERTGVQAVPVNAGAQDTIVIRGPLNEQMSTLIAMLSYRPAAGQQYRDETGILSAVTAEQFRAFDQVQTRDGPATFGYEGRLAYIFDALYGDPGDGIPFDPSVSSQNPHLNSIAGRIGALETGRLPTRLEAAPTDASGEAPESIDRRMVVEDYDSATQETRLRTISIGDLAGLDDRMDRLDQRVHGVERRITGLETEVAGVAAISSALSALPNTVPGGRRFYAGVGLGSYSGQSAVAVGASAKVSDGIYVNAGFSKGTNTSLTSRLGIGLAW